MPKQPDSRQSEFLFPEEKKEIFSRINAKELPETWRKFLGESAGSMADEILRSVAGDRKSHTVFPPENMVFHAFALTPPDQVRVVLIGQDPYHDDNQAEGLAFSVRDGIKIPASLRNIFKEYTADLNAGLPASGSLRPWAENGILLLNSLLTVRAHTPGSHRAFGWETFTDSVIRALNRIDRKLVFLLWGNYAQAKSTLIDSKRHTVLVSAHPSPLSAHRGFLGSRPFTKTESALGGNWRWPRLPSSQKNSR